ncbi:MarR family winged helix-turn-helix transcriptional regulator [Saccharibacillus sp. JS10]|uniref:MarR family winged helix-turn-helix transcriptional regulator n=1 Tax=Saccharibacillus sp. JS10 TaxID=2950552 RepID=UPI00210A8E7F|nr:MarR family winged helix-turn-helix transcriptional regulator [Saccharibacillus sp. JS10]MCQ4088618.1 MarR family winged helix-turn-helix transcriptional regulator [Saccharibacillus sp. JS10]
MKEVLREIENIARCSQDISSIEFKHLKLSRGLHIYLTFICENPGEPAGTVPDRLKVKRAAASRALQKLEDEGLIMLREASNLRKDKRVYPTENGKSAYLFIQQEGEYTDESSLRGLSPEEIAQLLDMLHRVRLNVEKDWRFVQKGGRRPYIHDYYNRLVQLQGSEPIQAKKSRSEDEPISSDLDSGPVEETKTDDPRQVSLWTYED